MAVTPRSTTVGLAGLGNLGLPLAATLVRAGWELAVLDSVPEHAEPVVALGAKAVSDVAALADRDVLLLAVPDDAAVVPVPLAGWLARTVAERVETHARNAIGDTHD